jgi:hypothetical protein
MKFHPPLLFAAQSAQRYVSLIEKKMSPPSPYHASGDDTIRRGKWPVTFRTGNARHKT